MKGQRRYGPNQNPCTPSWQDYYRALHACIAVVPAFASPAYNLNKGSSSVAAVIAAGTPLLADRALLWAYSFLQEEAVLLAEEGGTGLQVGRAGQGAWTQLGRTLRLVGCTMGVGYYQEGNRGERCLYFAAAVTLVTVLAAGHAGSSACRAWRGKGQAPGGGGPARGPVCPKSRGEWRAMGGHTSGRA